MSETINKTKKRKTIIILAFISVMMIIVGDYKLIELNNESYYKNIKSIGYFLQPIVWILYYFKHHYNKNEKNTL